MNTYTVDIYDKNDNYLATLPFSSFEIKWRLNGINGLQARINVEHLQSVLDEYGSTVLELITGGYRWGDVKRNNVTIFRGILADATIWKQNSNIELTVSIRSWLSYFEKRYITKTYNSTAGGAIAWDIINTVQSVTYGNIGVTQGTIDTVTSRDLTCDKDDVAKQLIHLSSEKTQNGYEFEITNDKKLTVKARIGVDKPNIILDEREVEEYTIDLLTGLAVTTQVHALGNGTGDTQIIAVSTASTTLRDKWYLTEDYINNTSISRQPTLQAFADKNLAELQDSRAILKRVVVVNNAIDVMDYAVGDGVHVIIPNICDGMYRILEKEVRLTDGKEITNLAFI